jgi:membrane protein DedA with SNARE-associated domain
MKDSQRSDDFTIVNRYGGALWPVSWLQHGYSFAWHVDADENFIEKAKAVEHNDYG